MSTGRLVIKILDLLVDETDCPKEAADILVLASLMVMRVMTTALPSWTLNPGGFPPTQGMTPCPIQC